MSNSSGIMAGKRGLIMGVANERSIAWGIAKVLSESGAKLAFTYQGEAFEKRIKPLARSVGSNIVLQCDVEDSNSLQMAFDQLSKTWGTLDFIVHSIAYSDKDELNGRYVDTTPENFIRTMNISCFSFTAVAKAAYGLMKKNGGSKSNETGGVVESKMGGGFAQKMNDGLMGGIQEGDEEDAED